MASKINYYQVGIYGIIALFTFVVIIFAYCQCQKKRLQAGQYQILRNNPHLVDPLHPSRG